jgi:hypothetical protein
MKKISLTVFYLVCQLSFASNYPYDSVAHAAGIGKCYTGAFENLMLVLKLQVGLDDKFCSAQKDLLDKALTIFLKRAMTNRVIDCAFARAKKDLPASRDIFVGQLYQALSPVHIDDNVIMPSLAFISMYCNDANSVGIGYVNLFYDNDKPLPCFSHRHFLHIALNKDYLGPHADYCCNTDAEYWAGVIGHEFLHNLGYRHPTGYEGSFIKEYGQCIENDGLERDLPRGLRGGQDRRSNKLINICG